MKNKLYFLCTGLMFISIFNSCSDDMEGVKPTSGSEIGFSIVDSRSRTEYDPNNEFQINWVNGDKVRIFCDKAEDIKKADYEVININNNQGSLKSIEGGLKWGGDEEHTFYAIYPADDTKIKSEPDNNGIITLNLNKNQICSFTTDADGNYKGIPDMKNAYMLAELKTTPIDQVPLNFKPLMTTLEITVRGKNTGSTNQNPVVLTGLNIINNNVKDYAAYQGNFQYDLINRKFIEGSSSKPFTQTIFVGIENGEDDFIDLSAGKSATFTVFLPPVSINENYKLVVRPSVAGDSELEVEIGGNKLIGDKFLDIPACSKAKITLPEWVSDNVNGNNWITPLDNNIYIQQLSIPGTHDSGTASTTLLNIGKTQALGIEEQWNIGVRAFDLRLAYYYDIFDQEKRGFWLWHGITRTGYSLQNVLDILNSKLDANPKEFAILQIRHENEQPAIGKDTSNDAWNKLYSELLGKLVQNNRAIQWKPDLTIEDCRGKVIVLTRNQYDGMTLAGYIENWPNNELGEATISNEAGNVFTTYYVQDYYDYSYIAGESGKKINKFTELLNITNKFNNPNSDDFNIKAWALNHTSGYNSDWGAGTTNAYMSNAEIVTPTFYRLLNESNGPTGIIFTDYVGLREAPSWGLPIYGFTMYGDVLVQSIINCNYRYYMLRKMN